MAERSKGAFAHIPLVVRAVAGGLAVGLVAANVWPLLLLGLGVIPAVAIELPFLAAYVWWLTGAGPGPWRTQRRALGRGRVPRGREWPWGLAAALSFAATVHAAIVLLFRVVPFPAAEFHAGYDFSFIPSVSLMWLACVASALSAGVCEEMGFRGYMQAPLEARYGRVIAIAVSSVFFMLLHLNKSWALATMTPIILGAGVMLGILAWASRTLVFCMLGHWIMDIGLFAYWWVQIAGTFRQRPVSETGVEPTLFLEVAAFAAAVAVFVLAVRRLATLAEAGASGDPRGRVVPAAAV